MNICNTFSSQCTKNPPFRFFWDTRYMCNKWSGICWWNALHFFLIQACRELKNFSSLKAIISALQSHPIHRLRRSWSSVPKWVSKPLTLNVSVPKKNDMWKGYSLGVTAPTFRKHSSLSNEIILHKVSEMNGSERTLEKTTTHLHCLQGITGNYFGNYLDSLLSDPLLWNLLFHYLMNLFFWMLVQCTSKMCPFHILSKIFLGYRYTLQMSESAAHRLAVHC